MVHSFFATPILQDQLRQNKLNVFNRDLLEQCYLVEETDGEGQDWSAEHYPHGYTSYGSITDLHRRYPHFEELAVDLTRHARKLARRLEWDLQGGKLEMSTCWVNIMPASAAHSLHLHPLSVLSGTYYVSVPKGASHIKFEDPRLNQFMAAPPKLPGARSKPFVTLQPKSGDVLLWESWLRHEVAPNASREPRVSISFNFDWV